MCWKQHVLNIGKIAAKTKPLILAEEDWTFGVIARHIGAGIGLSVFELPLTGSSVCYSCRNGPGNKATKMCFADHRNFLKHPCEPRPMEKKQPVLNAG